MRALRFHQTGDLSYLKIEEVPLPEPKEGELLVQVKAAGINPSDIKNVLGNMKGLTTLPRIPGRDFAGIVVKGAKREGQAVFGSSQVGFDRDGTHAEYVVVSEQAVVAKPDSFSFEVCAALGIPYITAWAAIVDAARLSPDEGVLITGAHGAVGSVAAEIAKAKGARIIGAVRKASGIGKTPYVDVWIDLEKEDLFSAVMQATGQKGVNASLDTIGGPLFGQCIKSLAERGRHVVIATQEPQVSFNLLEFYRRQGTIIGINTLRFRDQETAAILQNVLPLISRGQLQTPAPKLFPLDRALEAYQQVHAGTVKGKVVITI